VSTTNMMRSRVSTPLLHPSTLDPGMLANIIQSGIIPPLQMAQLQQKLSAMSMGGLSVPLPPINVTPLPLFKTPDASGFMGLGSLAQALPQVAGASGLPVNQQAVFNVVKVLANETRQLMVSRNEAEIDKQVKLLTNPISKRSVDHDLRLLDCVFNIKQVLMDGPNLLVATYSNYEAVNRVLVLVLSAVQEVEDRCKSDHAKHLVAQKSSYGWKFVSSLETWRRRWAT
jgi:hypothetical protein